MGIGGVVTPSSRGAGRIDGYVTPFLWVTVMADGVVTPSLGSILVPKKLSVVVPLGGVVVDKLIGKPPKVPIPSSATEVGLEVLELGVIPLGGVVVDALIRKTPKVPSPSSVTEVGSWECGVGVRSFLTVCSTRASASARSPARSVRTRSQSLFFPSSPQ